MEFEEMKKIWDSQNNETVYAINEEALYNRILSKKRTTNSITNCSELLLIIVNAGSSVFITAVNSLGKASILMYTLSVWMIGTALYVIVGRISRKRAEKKFNKTMLDELNQAIVTAAYQVRLSQLMRWNIIPVGALSLIGLWGLGKPMWAFGLIAAIFILSYYASGWEHRIYKSRKRELEILKEKLNNEH